MSCLPRESLLAFAGVVVHQYALVGQAPSRDDTKQHLGSHFLTPFCLESPLILLIFRARTKSPSACATHEPPNGARYMLGILSSVLEEVENSFEAFQFYKASQVIDFVMCDDTSRTTPAAALNWCDRQETFTQCNRSYQHGD